MQAGVARSGPRARRARDPRGGVAVSRRDRSVRGRVAHRSRRIACRLPEGRSSRSPSSPATSGIGPPRSGLPRRAATCAAGLRWLAAEGRGPPLVRAAATDPRALERLVRLAYRHAARYYLEVARTPAVATRDVDERIEIETPEPVAEAFATAPVIFVGLHFGSLELPACSLANRVGGRSPRWRPSTTRTPGMVRADPRRAASQRGPARGAPRAAWPRCATGRPSGSSATGDLTGGGTLIAAVRPRRCCRSGRRCSRRERRAVYVVGVRGPARGTTSAASSGSRCPPRGPAANA